jgi:lysozyme
LLWGTYHYGTAVGSGAEQAAFFLNASRPGPKTLLALDLEANDNNPSNSMTLDQAEAFVRAVAEATGRLPVVYVHPTWANGDPLPGSGLTFGAVITPDSIVARCGLWVADYHDSPEIPRAWAGRGWRLWQYAGDESTSHPAYGQTSFVQGVSRCDRNLFNGDEAALYRFWSART